MAFEDLATRTAVVVADHVLNDACVAANAPSRYGWAPLAASVRLSDPISTVQQLVEDGAEVNAVDGDGYTALFFAAWRSTLPVVAFLLAHGADPNVASQCDGTPLSKSLSEYRFDIALCLLKNGAAVHDMASAMKLCLSSPFKEQEAILRHLLAAGGDAVVNSMPSALNDAIVAKLPVSILKLLVEHGAEIRAHPYRSSSLATAVTYGHRDAVTWLIATCGISISKGAALMSAVQSQRVEILQDLIEAGDNVNAQSGEGVSALLFAADKGMLKSVSILEAAGANYEGPTDVLDKALLGAATSLGVHVCRRLLTAGATQVSRALLNAAGNYQIATVSMLLEHGAAVNRTNDNGDNSLMLCLKYTCADEHPFATLTALIEAGTDVNILNVKGGSPLREALSRYTPSPRIIRALLDAGAVLQPRQGNTNNPFVIVVQYAPRGIYKQETDTILAMLVEAGYDVNAPTMKSDYSTVLHQAIQTHQVSSVPLLLSAGARADRLPADALYKLAGGADGALQAAMESGAKIPIGDAFILQYLWHPGVELVRTCIADGAVVTGVLTSSNGSLMDTATAASGMPDILMVAGFRLEHATKDAGRMRVEATLCKWARDCSLCRRELNLSAWLRRRAGIRFWHAARMPEE